MAGDADPGDFVFELGFTAGVAVSEVGKAVSPETVRDALTTRGLSAVAAQHPEVLNSAALWGTLRTLAKREGRWSHDTKTTGLENELLSLATSAPSLWAVALPYVLGRSEVIGDVAEVITIDLGTRPGPVRDALEAACDHADEHIRLLARGLRDIVAGLDDPRRDFTRRLADAAARYFDGTPSFPHPLASISRTWLGSAGLEQLLSDGIRRAAVRFGEEVRQQGADREEALTKALVKEIEIEFREARSRTGLLPKLAGNPKPSMRVEQRPTSPSLEEPIYGCDLAILLDATIPHRFRQTWAELVQVKKSRRLQRGGAAAARADSWQIDSHQLSHILDWSQTATYWMIASSGEVLVVAARHLSGLRQGQRSRSTTFTVGYHEVRSAAIPLEQYLSELLVGQWAGTADPRVIEVAKGEQPNMVARLLLEITLAGGDN